MNEWMNEWIKLLPPSPNTLVPPNISDKSAPVSQIIICYPIPPNGIEIYGSGNLGSTITQNYSTILQIMTKESSAKVLFDYSIF